MPDYSKEIDAETWAFIHKTAEFYPPDAVALDVAGQRAVYDAMCKAFHRGYPAGISATDRAFGSVACRIYQTTGPMRATVLYLHGGGFVVGGLDSHDDICAEIAALTGYRVVSVDYRLAPEHKHPAAFDDAMTAARMTAASFGSPLLLVGDSAGGNLAAAVSHAARKGGPAIAGQVLIYPGLGGVRTQGSYVEHAQAPMLTRADIEFYAVIRFEEGVAPTGDPTAAPLEDDDFAGLPPTLIVTAGCDPLADDGPAYAARLRAAGGLAHAIEEAGLVHGYLRARATSRRAADSFKRITEGIQALGSGKWPW